jgi:flavin prenyltransferase
MKRLIVGISGASGAIYGIRLLKVLRDLASVETHLVLTLAARRTIQIETDFTPEKVEAMADHVHRLADIAAPISSGSSRPTAMIVAPCSMKTVSGIATSYSDNLLLRAADVILKERRRLVLLVRETPLHLGHLRLLTQVRSRKEMTYFLDGASKLLTRDDVGCCDLVIQLRLLTEMGAVVMPPVPAFYYRPTTLEDIIDQTVNRALDLLDVELDNDLFPRWDGPPNPASSKEYKQNAAIAARPRGRLIPT